MEKSDAKPGAGSARGVRRAPGLSRSIESYAHDYGYSPRALKRWLAIGRAVEPAPDPCPLDHPWLMPAWWSRRMKQTVPERVLKFAAAHPAPLENGDLPSPPSSTPAAVDGLPLFAASSPPPLRPAAPAGVSSNTPVSAQNATEPEAAEVGFEASLNRIRRAESVASKSYLDAVTANADAGVIEQKQRAWERTLEALRKLEKDGTEIRSSAGESISRSELRRELIELHRPLAMSLRSFLRRVRPKLKGLPDAEQDRLYALEVEQLFRRLRDNAFTGPVDVDAA